MSHTPIIQPDAKIALITGASRGIGASILEALLREGFIVIGTATSEQGAEAISQRIADLGGRGKGFCLNVSQTASVEALFSQMQASFGSPAVVINNAGLTRDNLFLRMKEEEWEAVMAANLTGVFRVTRACVKAMVKARWGRIIQLGSVVGSSGNPGQANYCATKAGLIGFSKALAQELGSRGITVNVVAPGFIGTDMTQDFSPEQQAAWIQKIPVQRMGTPQDVAAAVVFLASESASYITGQVLHVNGGLY